MLFLRIAAVTMLPVLFAILFYLLDTRTAFGKWSVIQRQIVIGLAFGVLACLGTQFGIPYDKYVLNVRSAAPLTAGLVFGGPAGMIAGTIGALYRWFSVYWGVPSYTRLACSVATFLAGLTAALCRRYMFDKKKTSWFYGMFLAVVTEVFHMLLVFVTHMDDIVTAFEVVRHTAVIMIAANSVSVLLALLFVKLVSDRDRRQGLHPMTQTFAVYLFISVLLAFVATSYFTFDLQNNVADFQVEKLLSMNIGDVEADISDALDRDLLNRCRIVADSLPPEEELFDSDRKQEARMHLSALLIKTNVSEISVVGPDGIIAVSTDPKFDGFDMNGKPDGQAAEFLCLLEGESSYVQNYQPIDYDSSVWCKYAGISLNEDGFVQVGYDKEHFEQSMREQLKHVAVNRHIGQSGFVFILDPSSEKPIVSAPDNTVSDESISDFIDAIASLEDGKTVSYETPEGEEYYFMKDSVESYIVIGCIPAQEAFFSRDTAVYIGAFMQLVVFFMLFLIVFFLLKKGIVDNIHKINDSLAKITAGDLDTRVDVRENEEFASLSNDINSTVSKLKDYIHDAEKRIDQELAFAKAIQHSAIPSVFPPFPNVSAIDLYASMDTAKEVGGDFYDFYILGRNHLVFLVADVSGKGIPAAMFMMTAKTMIKSYAESGLKIADVFTQTNKKLCESNEAGMFVTAWMGVLNLKTGLVRFANAGHNPPAIRRRDGSFEFLRSRPGLVLAAMDGIQYRENTVQLEPGDEIFLYTDGVTEATDSYERLFGEERLIEVLDRNSSQNAEDLCKTVKKAIDSFVGSAPQFDDITMLSLKYRHYSEDTPKSDAAEDVQ